VTSLQVVLVMAGAPLVILVVIGLLLCGRAFGGLCGPAVARIDGSSLGPPPAVAGGRVNVGGRR
jgi:hypothetical protein